MDPTGTSANSNADSTPKRVREGENISPTADGNPAKRPRALQVTPERSYRDIVSIVKMAIVTEDFPRSKLGQDDVEPIHGIVGRCIDETPNESLPLLAYSSVLGGALMYSCHNQASVHWLIKAMAGKKVGEKSLKAIYAKDLPKPVKMAWKTKDMSSRDCPTLMARLQRYHPALNTSEWRIVGNLIEPSGQRMVVLMDEESADYIKAAGNMLFSGVSISVVRRFMEKEVEGSERASDTATVEGVEKASETGEPAPSKPSTSTEGMGQASGAGEPGPSGSNHQSTVIDDVDFDGLGIADLLAEPMDDAEVLEEI